MHSRILATTLLLPLLSLADDPAPVEVEKKDTPPTELPVLVITATRSSADPLKVPAQVRQLDAETLAERQTRTLPEALRELPGVMVQKTSNAQASPFIRGFTGFRNLALIDGVRFNNSTFREGPNQYWGTIDQYAIDRIELVPGQGSVLYGSDSIGGALNLFTRDSGFRDEAAGFFFHGQGDFRFAFGGESSTQEHLEFNFGEGGRWGLHLGASMKQFDDTHAAELGSLPYTGYNEWAYDLRLDVALDANSTLTAVHQQLKQDDAWRTHATRFGRSWQGSTVGTDIRRSLDQARTLSYLRLAGQDIGSFIDAASLTVSFQTADEYEHRIRRVADNRMDFSQVELNTLGFDLQLESNSPIGRLTYGVDYYHDTVSTGSQRYRLNGTFVSHAVQGPVGDDSSYDLLGIYLQDQIDIGQRVHLFIGGRYTYASAEVGRFQIPAIPPAFPAARTGSYQDQWTNFSASGRVVVDLDEKDRFKFYTGVSQGFRAPNLSDLSRLDIARTGELEIPTTNLEPEQFVNFEIGLTADTENWSASLAYFYNHISEMIIRQPTGLLSGANRVVIKSNGGEGFVQGIEFAGDYRFNPNWSIFGHLTWTEGEVDQHPNSTTLLAREPLTRVVPVMGRAGLRWQRTDRKVWTELVCLAHSRADKLNSADRRDTERIPPGGTPGFALLTLRGGWQVTKNLSLNAAIENLLDDDYRQHGSGSNEPGIGLVLGATVKF